MAGLATALAIEPSLPRQWKSGAELTPVLRPVNFRNKVMGAAAVMAMVKAQLIRLSRGHRPKPDISPIWTLIRQQIRTKLRARQYRRWAARQAVG